MLASYAYHTQLQEQLLITEKQFGAFLYGPRRSMSAPRHQINRESFEELIFMLTA